MKSLKRLNLVTNVFRMNYHSTDISTILNILVNIKIYICFGQITPNCTNVLIVLNKFHKGFLKTYETLLVAYSEGGVPRSCLGGWRRRPRWRRP